MSTIAKQSSFNKICLSLSLPLSLSLSLYLSLSLPLSLYLSLSLTDWLNEEYLQHAHTFCFACGSRAWFKHSSVSQSVWVIIIFIFYLQVQVPSWHEVPLGPIRGWRQRPSAQVHPTGGELFAILIQCSRNLYLVMTRRVFCQCALIDLGQ